MSDCESYRKLITDAAMEEISADENTALQNHLSRCSECRALLDESRRALDLYLEHAFSHPPESYWTDLAARIDGRIRTESAQHDRPAVGHRIRRPIDLPAWSLRTAIAALLFALGVLVGRATIDPLPSDEAVTMAGTAAIADAAIEQYLTRAQTLFLSLSNADTTEDVLAARMQAAERLLHDTRMLQRAVQNSDDAVFASLLDDVQLVLLQYTHTGTRRQAQAALDDLGLLLRINLYVIDRNRALRTVNL